MASKSTMAGKSTRYRRWGIVFIVGCALFASGLGVLVINRLAADVLLSVGAVGALLALASGMGVDDDDDDDDDVYHPPAA